MDLYRRPALQRKLRVLNQKEDRDLQCKLDLLDQQYRYTCRMLQQRRDSLIKQQRRVVMVKVCEPKATVNIAMKEIGKHMNAVTHVRGIYTSNGRRLSSSKSQYHGIECEPVEPSRSISAPVPPPVRSPSSVRHRRNIHSSLSFMKMKHIATIDSISEKEHARRQQRAREEMERLREFQRETLHKKVTVFIENLKDKRKMFCTTSKEELESLDETLICTRS